MNMADTMNTTGNQCDAANGASSANAANAANKSRALPAALTARVDTPESPGRGPGASYPLGTGRVIVPVAVPIHRLSPQEITTLLGCIVRLEELYQVQVAGALTTAELRSLAHSLPGQCVSLAAQVMELTRQRDGSMQEVTWLRARLQEVERENGDLRRDLMNAADMVGTR